MLNKSRYFLLNNKKKPFAIEKRYMSNGCVCVLYNYTVYINEVNKSSYIFQANGKICGVCGVQRYAPGERFYYALFVLLLHETFSDMKLGFLRMLNRPNWFAYNCFTGNSAVIFIFRLGQILDEKFQD